MQQVSSARDNGFVRTTKERISEDVRERRSAMRMALRKKAEENEQTEPVEDQYPQFAEEADASDHTEEADLGRGDFDEVEETEED